MYVQISIIDKQIVFLTHLLQPTVKAFFAAVLNKRVEIVDVLLEHGMLIDKQDLVSLPYNIQFLPTTLNHSLVHRMGTLR